jgi:hypothetical protein
MWSLESGSFRLAPWVSKFGRGDAPAPPYLKFLAEVSGSVDKDVVREILCPPMGTSGLVIPFRPRGLVSGRGGHLWRDCWVIHKFDPELMAAVSLCVVWSVELPDKELIRDFVHP